MISFFQYLTEAKSKAIPHLTHLGGEEHLYGKERTNDEMTRMDDMSKYFKGEKSNVGTIGIKADGSPSFEMGHVVNPHTDKREFGVAYKGAAKGHAFTQADVSRMFGHNEHLKSKMSQLLEHGSKILGPIHGVIQGDFMGSKKDGSIQKEGGEVTHKENLIKYHYPANSDEGKELQKSKISISLHTRIDKENPEYNIDTKKLHEHPDVHIFNNKLNKENVHYTPEDDKEYQSNMDKARKSLGKIKNHDELVEGHSEHLQTYINKTVREGTAPSASSYKKHLHEKLMKEVDKVSREDTKKRKKEHAESMAEDVDNNKEDFTHLFTAHKHLDKAKNVFLRTLENSGQNQKHTINGVSTKPEGFVVSYKDGNPRKIVNRSKEGFSGQNLNK